MPRPETPSAMARLIDALTKLPGVGKRSAQRIAFHLLKAPPEECATLAKAISDFRKDLRVCSECGNLTEADPCPICADPRRETHTLLVVEQPNDVATLEATGQYHGRYHVLMGRLAPLEGIGPGELNIHTLVERVKGNKIKEVILGTNPTLEGDGTSLYLAKTLEPLGVRVTRLARGLPTGTSLEVVSKAVLAEAIAGRGKLSDGTH
ncbi:MAG: recombination protein RecR [Phycisphaera sp.]|nr:recombination protein RecR [Phycisphaera sp.]